MREISSVYTIEKVQDKLIIFADRKVIQLHSNIAQTDESIHKYNMETITTITDNPFTVLMQSVTDKKGRTIIGNKQYISLLFYY